MSFLRHTLLLRSSRRENLKRRLVGLVRVSTYLTVVAGLSSIWLVRAASARIDEAVQQFGETLLRQLGPDMVGQTQELLVNDQRVFLSSKVAARPLDDTLDELDRHCEGLASPALSSFENLPPSKQAEDLLTELGNPRRWSMQRQVDDDLAMGQVACIAHPQDDASVEETVARAVRFVETGDLAALGDARYFLARKLADDRTHVISIWTEGHFDLAGMFSAEGDAPGSDSSNLPRPPGARRTFSALVPDRPYAVRMYESHESRESILAYYDEAMPKAGWVERPTSEGDELRVLVRAFSRADTVALVILDAEREGDRPVTLVELGGKGFAHATAAASD
jgi:hypothetical protein